ncbi:MAG TPA: hypothetical protein VMV91_07010 [Rhodocyclaceae bacterium]|nr:hypothetical protein [Rhodocyclaceae bacterium]
MSSLGQLFERLNFCCHVPLGQGIGEKRDKPTQDTRERELECEPAVRSIQRLDGMACQHGEAQ